MSNGISIEKGVLLVKLALDILTGDKQDALAVAKELSMLAIDMVPSEDLKEFLTQRDRDWANASADIGEAIKFGPKE